MNLIGSSCITAFLYRDWYKVPYNNPFMWNAIDFDSFYFLAKNFHNINFDKWELERYSELQNGFQVIIDGKIKLKYIHYLQDDKCESPTQMELDVHYKNIAEYIKNKYLARLERMKANKDNPIFILDASVTSKAVPQFTPEQVQAFANLNVPYKRLLVVPPGYKIKHNPRTTELYVYRSGAKSINAKTIYLRKVIEKWL